MTSNIYEENQAGPVAVAEQPAPAVYIKEAPAPQPVESKPKKGKKAFGIVASIICFLVGIVCLAGEICGIGGFALIACLFSNVELPQELENIAYGLSGTGLIIGVLFVLDLLAVILIVIFSSIAVKKTDCPKFMSVLSLIVSILALVFYVLLIAAIIVSVLIVVKGAGLESYVGMLFGGGAE